MMRFANLRSRLTGFRKSENGSASIELVFMVPVLAWITFALVSFFAAYKADTHATRAATVIADMVSRETNPITPNFLTGVDGLLNTLIRNDDTPEYRLTVFKYDADADKYGVAWSKENSEFAPLTDAGIDGMRDRLPNLRDGQRAILLETWIDYEPVVKIGMTEATEFETFMVTAPRFVPQLCFASSETADPTTAVC